jgi:hypothetical protein
MHTPYDEYTAVSVQSFSSRDSRLYPRSSLKTTGFSIYDIATHYAFLSRIRPETDKPKLTLIVSINQVTQDMMLGE